MTQGTILRFWLQFGSQSRSRIVRLDPEIKDAYLRRLPSYSRRTILRINEVAKMPRLDRG